MTIKIHGFFCCFLKWCHTHKIYWHIGKFLNLNRMHFIDCVLSFRHRVVACSSEMLSVVVTCVTFFLYYQLLRSMRWQVMNQHLIHPKVVKRGSSKLQTVTIITHKHQPTFVCKATNIWYKNNQTNLPYIKRTFII